VIEGSFNFFLAPQTAPDELDPWDPVYLGLFMAVLNQEQKPVLIAEIMFDSWVNSPHYRQRADTQMRHWFDQMLQNCPLPRLYGLSLLGTSLRVYCADKATGLVTPQFVGHPDPVQILPRNLPSNFLEGQWDVDILSPEGLKKMQEIVTYIKAEVDKV
jgi:hypothetical protein